MQVPLWKVPMGYNFPTHMHRSEDIISTGTVEISCAYINGVLLANMSLDLWYSDTCALGSYSPAVFWTSCNFKGFSSNRLGVTKAWVTVIRSASLRKGHKGCTNQSWVKSWIVLVSLRRGLGPGQHPSYTLPLSEVALPHQELAHSHSWSRSPTDHQHLQLVWIKFQCARPQIAHHYPTYATSSCGLTV